MVQEIDNSKTFIAGLVVIAVTFVMILFTAFSNPAVDRTYENVGTQKAPVETQQIAGE